MPRKMTKIKKLKCLENEEMINRKIGREDEIYIMSHVR